MAKVEKDFETMRKIGARLKHLREAKGYTSLDEMAYDIRINRTQLSRYEAGQDMQVTTLLRLVKFFGLTLEEFFGEGF